MKNTRKILTFVLSLALLVVGFSVTAFAADGDSAPKTYEQALADDSKVLEFYEAGTYFELKVDNSGIVTTYDSDECKLLKGGAYTESVSVGALSFTSVNPTKINLVQDTPDSFGVNLRAKVSEASPLTLYVASSKTGDYLSLFSVSVGKVTYKFNSEKLTYEEKAMNIASGEFFDLSIYLEKGKEVDTVYFSIKTDKGESWTDSYTYGNDKTDFLAGTFDYDYAYLASSAATFNYVEMYPGTFQRYVDNSKNLDIIADGVVNTYNDYLNFKNKKGGAYELAEIIAKVAVLYEYPLNSVADASVKASLSEAFADCVAVVSKTYAEDVSAKGAELLKTENETKDYNERLTFVSELLGYEDYMTNLQRSAYASASGVDFTAMRSAFDAADVEVERLAEIEENSIFVVDEISKITNIYLATYEQLKTAYEAIKDVEIYDSYSSELYPTEVVTDAVQKKSVVLTNYPLLDSQAKAFIMSVNTATNTDKTFTARYYAYVKAKENYFDDYTYDNYLTDVTVAVLNARFATVEAEMLAVSEVAEQFLAKIREAALTPSYTVKIIALDEAQQYLDIVEKGYPEVEASIESYYAMREEITSRKEAARRYVQAVLNVQLAATVSEKAAAIEIAEAFAVLGNEYSIEVEGMEMTVTEANVILAYEKSAVSLKATRINNFVTAVNVLAEKEALLDRRQAINTAIAVKALLEDDMDEADVISAANTLDAAIEAYNDDVRKANSEATETDNAVLSVLSRTVPAKRIAEVVAIVKKFYE